MFSVSLASAMPRNTHSVAKRRHHGGHLCFLRFCRLVVGLLLFLLPASWLAAAASRPVAAQGVLDLSHWDFSQGHVALDGEWEFHWRRWIEPGQTGEDNRDDPPLYVSVPGSWTRASEYEQRLPPYGFGTYRLRVLLGESGGPLALSLSRVNSAFTLWVNGHQLIRNGMPASSGTMERPAGGSVIIGLGAGHSELDIVLQVSNHTFRDGGINASIMLGDANTLTNDFKRSLTINVVLVASLFVIGLYHLGIWAIRPGFFHALYLGLFCLVLSARVVMMDHAPITFFVPDLSREWLLKVEYLGFYLGGALLALFLQAMYPEEIRKRPIAVVVAISLMFAAAVLVTPGRINSQLVLYYELIVLIYLPYLTVCLMRAVRHGRYGSSLLLTATVLFFLVFIHDMLYFWGFFPTRQLAPFAILGLVLAYSLTLAKRFINELDRQRLLTEQNLQLVEQVKASRRLLHQREEETRRSLADLLHGTVQSRLLSARHFLQKAVSALEGGVSPEEHAASLKDFVQKASEQIDRSREDLREISHMLHPTLITMGLVPAVRTLLQRFDGQFDMDLQVTGKLAQDPAAEERLERSLRLIAYRIVEEALNNVVKHAEATRVVVALDMSDDTLSIEVRDDGKGVSAEAAGRGLGLQMIASRAEELHGSFTFESVPGAGTSLRVTIPLSRE